MNRNKMQDQAGTVNPKERLGFMKGGYHLPDNFEKIDKVMDKEIEEIIYSGDLEPRAHDSGRAATDPPKKLTAKG